MANTVEAKVLNMYTLSESKPRLRKDMISRVSYLDFFHDSFESYKVLCVDGEEGVGVTSTLAMFANMHGDCCASYFFTYLTIMHKYSTPIMMPVVIDEFKQNGTTDQSIDKMIEFAINHRPKDGQVFYSISGDYSATGNNVKTVSLDDETLMNESEYESVRNEVDDILNKNFRLK